MRVEGWAGREGQGGPARGEGKERWKEEEEGRRGRWVGMIGMREEAGEEEKRRLKRGNDGQGGVESLEERQGEEEGTGGGMEE